MRATLYRPRALLLPVLGAAAVSALATDVPEAVQPESLNAGERAQIEELFKEYDSGSRPGCALGVMRDGHLAYARGFGLADLEHNVRITPATLFDIASTSKQFTAGAVLLLMLEGKLALSDDVRKYVPELPDYGAAITIDHLLRHTSGLRDYIALLSLAGIDKSQVSTAEQALALIVRQRMLNFPTGSRYEYSNTGYFLLSVIVQRVSGKSLAEFARERLFLPLGMTNARFADRYDMIIPGRALGYASTEGQASAATGELSNAMSNWEQIGDGGLHLSVEDAAKWDRNFYEPRVGGPAFLDRLQEVGTLEDGSPIAYARGLMVDHYRGLRRVQHAGNWAGYNAALQRFPEQRTSVAIFCNFAGNDAARLADRVADVVLASVLPAEAAAPAAAPSGAKQSLPRERFIGRYFAADSGLLLEVAERERALVLKSRAVSLPLNAIGPTRFAVGGYPATVEFSIEGRAPAHALQLRVGDDPPMVAQRFVPTMPSAPALRAYTGTFYSPELDLSWLIESDGEGRLLLRKETKKYVATTEPLEPAMTDAFGADSGFMRFARDGSGHVAGFELSSARMHGIRFERRPHD